jgi:signal transduction histidine kinase
MAMLRVTLAGRSVAVVVEQLWRAVGAFRFATLAYAAVLVFRDHGAYAHPARAYAALAVMAAWSLITVAAYARPAARRPWFAAFDVAVAVALVLGTRAVATTAQIDHGSATLPASWAAASVLACAVMGGPWAGLAGAAAVSAADLVERGTLAQNTFNGIVLLVIAGLVGGYVVRLVLRAEAAVERAARLDAATAERRRIARDIHDSVLQVLVLVHARGRELGGEAAELGRLAGEQETALRSLVAMTPVPAGDGRLDVRALLETHAGERVEVSCPAYVIPLREETALAVAAATDEALSNVRRHAGPDARAWILVEEEDDAVTVSVRDNGIGFAAGRPGQASAEGRLGLAQSIVGRIRDAGGEATVTSTPGRGTEVELRVPRT